MNTTSPTQPTVKDLIAAKLARYADVETVIDNVTREQQQKVQAIIAATRKALSTETKELETLEQEIEALAVEHREALYGKKSKSLDMGTHVCSFRASDVIECEDEEEVVAALLTTVEDPETDEADRIAAAACLSSPAPKLDKAFVRKHWARHCAWFSGYFGLRKVRKEKFAIKAKATPESESA